MVEKQILITNPSGLHTRPAKQIVDKAREFACEIQISKGEKTGNAKNLIKLMKLGIAKNSTITISCDGTDENDAMGALEKLIADLSE